MTLDNEEKFLGSPYKDKKTVRASTCKDKIGVFDSPIEENKGVITWCIIREELLSSPMKEKDGPKVDDSSALF